MCCVDLAIWMPVLIPQLVMSVDTLDTPKRAMTLFEVNMDVKMHAFF